MGPHLPLFVCPSCMGLPALWDKAYPVAFLNTFRLHRGQSLKLSSPHLQSSQGKNSESPCMEMRRLLVVSHPTQASNSTMSLVELLAHRPSCHKPAVPCHSLCNPCSSQTQPFPNHSLGDPAETHSIYPSTSSWQNNNIISIYCIINSKWTHAVKPNEQALVIIAW